jgi:hypothetical protein
MDAPESAVLAGHDGGPPNRASSRATSTSTGATPEGFVSSSFRLPATINVGDSGTIDTLTYYHDGTMSTVDADETTTYSVMGNDSTSLLLCLTSTISGVTAQGTADGLTNGTESDCYSVNASGTADLFSIALTIDGAELNFK